MSVKREKLLNYKRDLILGIVEDPFRKRLDLEEENNKVTITNSMLKMSTIHFMIR